MIGRGIKRSLCFIPLPLIPLPKIRVSVAQIMPTFSREGWSLAVHGKPLVPLDLLTGREPHDWSAEHRLGSLDVGR